MNIKNTIKLLRLPFSILLMPIFILTLSQIKIPFTWIDALIPFLIIHLLVYPASNGYNSYVDRDEGSIGGLEKPPMPTIELFYVTLAMDILAILLSYIFINTTFTAYLILYILASRAYSARQIRLKKFAIIGFLIVIVFQGGYTVFLSYLGITKQLLPINDVTIWLLLACTFQIAGVYPLTQIYQHKQDFEDSVVTISYKLGYVGTFIFAGIMFALCNVCYFLYFSNNNDLSSFIIVQFFFAPILVFFIYWMRKVLQSTLNANFRNTMLMNLIAAFCMNICFVILFLNR